MDAAEYLKGKIVVLLKKKKKSLETGNLKLQWCVAEPYKTTTVNIASFFTSEKVVEVTLQSALCQCIWMLCLRSSVTISEKNFVLVSEFYKRCKLMICLNIQLFFFLKTYALFIVLFEVLSFYLLADLIYYFCLKDKMKDINEGRNTWSLHLNCIFLWYRIMKKQNVFPMVLANQCPV